MIIKYDNYEVDLFSRGTPDRILLALSGGLDSASLLFLICKNFPEVEIIPYTGKDKYAPFDLLSAQMVVQWMKEKFPNHNILKHEWFEFDIKDPKLIKMAEDNWENAKVMIEGKMVERCTTINGLIKIIEIGRNVKALLKKYNDPMWVTGQTSNPPIEEMIKHNFYDVSEKRRNYTDIKEPYGVSYQPYINVDKKFITNVYYENDIKDLYDLTSSCIGNSQQTNYFTEICGKCFWCKEKAWAVSDDKFSGNW